MVFPWGELGVCPHLHKELDFYALWSQSDSFTSIYLDIQLGIGSTLTIKSSWLTIVLIHEILFFFYKKQNVPLSIQRHGTILQNGLKQKKVQANSWSGTKHTSEKQWSIVNRQDPKEDFASQLSTRAAAGHSSQSSAKVLLQGGNPS